MTKLFGNITSITLGTEVGDDLYECTVVIDDFDSYLLYGGRDEYMSFIHKDVEFTLRRDVVNGIIREVIGTIAVKSVIQTVASDSLDEFETSSLIPNNNNTVSVITFDKNSLKADDVALAQIILVVEVKDGKSRVAKWKDFSCLDVNSQVFNLRLFTNNDNVDEFCKLVLGHYAMVDIINHKKYGFQVHKDFEVYEQEVMVPSEVVLARMRLAMTSGKDEQLLSYLKKYNMIDSLKGLIYFEPGYHLVEMAAELMLINTVCSIFEGYDKKLLTRVVFTSRGYLLGSDTHLSNPIVNYHRIITSDLKNDFELIKLLDFMSGVDEGDINKAVYLSIRRQVTSIMKERRGISETLSVNTVFSTLDSQYSGMFRRGLGGLD